VTIRPRIDVEMVAFMSDVFRLSPVMMEDVIASAEARQALRDLEAEAYFQLIELPVLERFCRACGFAAKVCGGWAHCVRHSV